MTAQKGKDLLLKMEGRTNTFETVIGLRSRTLSFNAEAVDITDSESQGRWRHLLAGAGVRRASLSGSGIFKDAASDARVRVDFFDGTIRRWQIVIPDFGTIKGNFQITTLEYAGEYNREVTYEIGLESAGALEFA